MASTPLSMLRIVSTGLQDTERLNSPMGQPSIKFYSGVFIKRTRWASQWRRVEFDNLADFGRKATVTLPILGELITRVTLVVELPDIATKQYDVYFDNIGSTQTPIGPWWAWTNSIGHALCSDVEFSIGNQVVDRLDSRLLEVLDEQHNPVEHFDTKDELIFRFPTDYSQYSSAPDPYKPIIDNIARLQQTLEIEFPFWWNRGPGPQALPIQALAKDKVQISVTFRTMQECVFTNARVDSRNPGAEASQAGPMPLIAGCGFYKRDPVGVPIHNIYWVPGATADNNPPVIGKVIPGANMPTDYHFLDAYWIVEYVSLEDREAAAFRMADLEIPIEQHVAVPVTNTAGASSVRIPLNQGGLVRDMTWVAQRPDVTDYNAYFLFSRDLYKRGPLPAPTNIPWWPNAIIPNWDYGNGYIYPAFANAGSDPIAAATMRINGLRRFELEGPSFFRSLIPALNCERTPLIDRYIYRYDFGFWPTGGLAETLDFPRDEVRGFSNWDKLPNKELELHLNLDECKGYEWVPDPTQAARTYKRDTADIDTMLLKLIIGPNSDQFSIETEGFHVRLVGGKPEDFGGKGAVIEGIIDYQALRRAFGNNANLLVRVAHQGSASLLVSHNFNYTWLAVAGGGGFGSWPLPGAPKPYRGGSAASAVEIGYRGDRNPTTLQFVQSHEATADGFWGGAGGGLFEQKGVGKGGLGPAGDGTMMTTDHSFVFSDQRTGGADLPYTRGGDGWTGGGSGTRAGGGGGSYVSRYITQVMSQSGDDREFSEIENPDEDPAFEAQIVITPLRRVNKPNPDFNIYVWLTRYNMLRISGGRGALMFSE